MIKPEILGPVIPELGHGYLQPGLHVSVEVDDGSLVDDAMGNTSVVAESQHMPRFVERHSQLVEGDQARWQRPELPHHPVLVLH